MQLLPLKQTMVKPGTAPFGEPASVADVIVTLRQAGLKPPEPPSEYARADMASGVEPVNAGTRYPCWLCLPE